jgi:hypothetical protein
MNWGVLFLGIIAISILVQTLGMIRLALEWRRLSARFDGFQDRFEREIRPALDHLTRITRNLAEVSDTAVLQARRIDELVADTVEKIEDTTGLLRKLILRPLGPLVDIAAFLKGIRRGLDVYHQLRGFESHGKGSPTRRYADEDEHLFI